MTKHKINPDIFSVLNAADRKGVLDSILPALMARWDEEEAAQLRDRRLARLCELAGGEYTHLPYAGDNAGLLRIDMPTMSCEALTVFCEEVLKLDLSDVDNGPGRMFRHPSIEPVANGSLLRIFYALDI